MQKSVISFDAINLTLKKENNSFKRSNINVNSKLFKTGSKSEVSLISTNPVDTCINKGVEILNETMLSQKDQKPEIDWESFVKAAYKTQPQPKTTMMYFLSKYIIKAVI